MKRLCLLLLSSMAFGQGVTVPTQQVLKTVNGVTSPVAAATITVCAANASGIPCTPALVGAIFKDAALTQPLTNPFTSDANGNYVFAIAPGNYTVTVTAATFTGYSYQTTAPVAANANNTFTGATTFSGAANLNGGGNLSGTFGGTGTFSGTNTFSGTTTAKNFEQVLSIDQWCNTPGTLDASCLQNAINASVNGKLYAPSGTYNLGTGNPAITWKTGIRLECASNQSTNFNYTGTGIAFQFGNGTTGVQYGIMENCSITLGAAGATAISLKGNSAANTNPSSKNLFRKNFITGSGFASTTGISVSDNSYANRFEYDEVVNIVKPLDFGTANFSGENNVVWADVIGCSGLASSIGVNIHQTAGPVETYVIGGDVVGCSTGIAINTGNNGTFYLGGGMHMEQNSTDIACTSTTTGGYIDGIDTTGTPAGAFASAHSITFAGCQNWDVRNVRNAGTYSADTLNLDATSASNTLQGYSPSGAGVVLAAGANNVFISGTAGRVEGIGGTLRSYRAANLLTQYVEFDGTGGNARVNTGAGFSTFDFAVNGTNVLEYSTTAFYPLTVNNTTLGTAALPWKSLLLGTAATNNFVFTPAATAAARTVNINDPGVSPVNMTLTIASGTATMTTAAITAGNCGTTVTVAATGVTTTDTITWAFNAAPAGSNAGIVAWPTSGNVNFAYCSNTAQTPAAATINWRVVR